MFKKPQYQLIKSRLEEPRRFIQVVTGPRQVGKTTVVKQVLKDLDQPFLYYSADNVPTSGASWVSDCWGAARDLVAMNNWDGIVLAIDEIQKIRSWSEVVKKEWDADSFADRNVKLLLLGSSRVLIEKGLSESLAGRYEEIRMSQWTFPEMRDCFGFSIQQYLFYGGYPGAATLIGDEDRFRDYVRAAIVDATVNKDILADTPISKPALMRQMFELGASYSGQLLSLNKMLGSLQDAGNTSTLAGYSRLLCESGMLAGLQKYSMDVARRKSSIPKWQVFDNALKTQFSSMTLEQALKNRKEWGHIFESGIGAYLLCQSFVHRFDLYYWRENALEVDFILRRGGSVVAIEVKSNDERHSAGLEVFRQMFHPSRSVIIGNGGIPVEDFLCADITKIF